MTDGWVLVGDVGGTNARFALADPKTLTLHHAATRATADFAGLAEAAQDYLQVETDNASPKQAAIAVASPVTGDDIAFTNNPWRFSTRQLQVDLQLDVLHIINDFTAQALAIPHLPATAIRPIGPDAPAKPNSPIAVLGPGTGLGVSGLLPDSQGRWVAIAGEGGHVSVAPETEQEVEILRLAWQQFGRTSAERLICGDGLVFLHEAVASIHGKVIEPLSSADITARALDGSCPLCRDTVFQFCALLGGLAGDLALTLGAHGGVFIAGGIAPRLGSLLDESPFRARFEHKGRFQQYNAIIPTWLVSTRDLEPALLGAASLFRYTA